MSAIPVAKLKLPIVLLTFACTSVPSSNLLVMVELMLHEIVAVSVRLPVAWSVPLQDVEEVDSDELDVLIAAVLLVDNDDAVENEDEVDRVLGVEDVLCVD